MTLYISPAIRFIELRNVDQIERPSHTIFHAEAMDTESEQHTSSAITVIFYRP